MSNSMKLVKMSYMNMMKNSKIFVFSAMFFVIGGLFNDMILGGIIGAIVCQFTQGITAYEDAYGIDYLISCLPIKRKDFVKSRYYMLFINLIIGIIIFTITYNVAKLKLDIPIDYWTMLIGATLLPMIGVSTLIPCLLKYGATKGRMLGIIIIVLSINAPMIFVNIVNEESRIVELISTLTQNQIILGVASISMLLVYISYIISLKIYNNKDFH